MSRKDFFSDELKRSGRLAGWALLSALFILIQIGFSQAGGPSAPMPEPEPEPPRFTLLPHFTSQPEPELNPACICPSSNGGIFQVDSCPGCVGSSANTYRGTTYVGTSVLSQDTGGHTVYLHNGEFIHHVVDLEIEGRGFNWKFERKYRSGVTSDGPLGHNWEFNYNRRLLEANAFNIVEIKLTLPAAKLGDVTRMDGNSRADLYVLNNDGSYEAPTGSFTKLIKNQDGSFVETDYHGTEVTYAAPDSNGTARMTSLSDRKNNTMRFEYNIIGQLSRVIDTLGRPIDYTYSAFGRLTQIKDFSGRTISFQYDSEGDLVIATSPAVTGTPNGNDFPQGKQTFYTYSSGFTDEKLNHNMLTITAPNEAASFGLPWLSLTYENADPASRDRVKVQFIGGTNSSGVQAGGSIQYQYGQQTTTVTDRNGNRTEYQFNDLGNIVRVREFTNREIRRTDPEFYETSYEYNGQGQLLKTTFPEGNSVENAYDTQNREPFQQANLISTTTRPDNARGGDQDSIKTVTRYEPIFNNVRQVIEPRGNDPDYQPQNGGTANAARYTTTYFYDYQEGNNYLALANATGRTEQQVRQMLTGIPMNLGDLNGDGITNQIMGNVVKVQYPEVTLLQESQMIVIEGGSSQKIATTMAYNNFGQIVRSVDAEGNVTTYQYDSVGYLQSMTVDAESDSGRNSGTDPAPAQITTQYFYDSVGNVIKQIDGRGIATEFGVNQLDQVVEIKSAADVSQALINSEEPNWSGCIEIDLIECSMGMVAFGYRTRFYYDHNNNVVRTEVENRDTNNPELVGQFIESTSQYDILNQLVERTDRISNAPDVSRTTRSRYDRNGNLVLTISPMAVAGEQPSNIASWVYDERDLIASFTRGGLTDQFKQIGSHEDIDEADAIPNSVSVSTTTTTYDKNSNVKTVTDAVDNSGDGQPETKTMLYDGFDRLISTIDGLGNQGLQEYDPAGNIVRLSTFGPHGGPSPINNQAALFKQPLKLEDFSHNLLQQTESLYDELGRLIESRARLFDYAGEGVQYQRDPQHMDGPFGGSDDGIVVKRVEYDRNSRTTFVTDDKGDTGQTFYDGVGRKIRFVTPEGNEQLFQYDDNSNLVKFTSVEVTQPEDVAADRSPELRQTFTTINVYDALNRLIRSTDTVGQTLRMSYDSRNNLKLASDAQHSESESDLITDPLGVVTAVQINRDGNTTEYFYDGLGRTISSVQMLRIGGQGQGNRDTSNPANPDGLVVMDYQYDLNDRLIATADDGSISGDQNTTIGVIESLNPKGNVTRYSHDDLNRIVQELLDDGTIKSIAYDADDLLVETIDENGSITANEYDGLGRIIRQQINRANSGTRHPAGGLKDSGTVWEVLGTTLLEYQYDGLSRLTRSFANNNPEDADDDALVTVVYDSLSRMLEEIQNGNAVSNNFDGNGNRIGLIYPNGTELQYTFDRHDRIKSITQNGSAVASYSYIGPGRVLERHYGNGTTLSRLDAARQQATGFDALGRLVGQRHLGEDTLIAGFSYSHNRINDITSETREHESGKTESYTFDSLYRLTDFSREGENPESWLLDGAHNWAQHNGQSNQSNSLHEYIAFNGQQQHFDDNGNLLDDGTFLFQYDASNHLKRVLRKADRELIAEYSYDAAGRRFQKIVTNSGDLNGIFTYLFDGIAEIEEHAADSAKQFIYGRSIVEPLSIGTDNNNDGAFDESFYYHQDGKTNVIALTDSEGQVVERISYSAYGLPSLTESAASNPYLFAAQRYEPETGLYYYRARFYDPKQGRFLQRDPLLSWIEMPPLGNRYAFVASNPINNTDPSGYSHVKVFDGTDGSWLDWGGGGGGGGGDSDCCGISCTCQPEPSGGGGGGCECGVNCSCSTQGAGPGCSALTGPLMSSPTGDVSPPCGCAAGYRGLATPGVINWVQNGGGGSSAVRVGKLLGVNYFSGGTEAVAIPAFMKNARKAKTSEATTNSSQGWGKWELSGAPGSPVRVGRSPMLQGATNGLTIGGSPTQNSCCGTSCSCEPSDCCGTSCSCQPSGGGGSDSLKYNFPGIEGAASAIGGSFRLSAGAGGTRGGGCTKVCVTLPWKTYCGSVPPCYAGVVIAQRASGEEPAPIPKK